MCQASVPCLHAAPLCVRAPYVAQARKEHPGQVRLIRHAARHQSTQLLLHIPRVSDLGPGASLAGTVFNMA